MAVINRILGEIIMVPFLNVGRRFGFSCLVLFILSSSVIGQVRVDPNEPPLKIDASMREKVIDQLAKELDENYVFPDIAKKMGESIKKKLVGKEYDAIETGQVFAKQLTEDLQAISKDKHIRVNCSTKPLPKRPEKSKEPSPEMVKRQKEGVLKSNAGFVKLERLPGNVGYLELRGFLDHEAGAETVTAAMNFLANTDALILDLRKNGGGSPHMVQLICSYFFPADKPVHLNSLYWRKGDRTDEFWTLKEVPGKRYLDKDIYVLTSGFTFSGAEECAYNLQTRKRATIVGETTGGGAHPGGGARINEHFVMFVPTGRAINPVTKTNWEGTGVKPEIEVDAEKALELAYEKIIKKFRETITDPERKQDFEMDLRREEMMKKRFEDRKKIKKD
jgi:hypothetical protein